MFWLASLWRLANRSGFTYEVIIVNDGSKDKTSAVAQSYVAKEGDETVRLCNLFKNCGKGGAVRKVSLQCLAESRDCCLRRRRCILCGPAGHDACARRVLTVR